MGIREFDIEVIIVEKFSFVIFLFVEFDEEEVKVVIIEFIEVEEVVFVLEFIEMLLSEKEINVREESFVEELFFVSEKKFVLLFEGKFRLFFVGEMKFMLLFEGKFILLFGGVVVVVILVVVIGVVLVLRKK